MKANGSFTLMNPPEAEALAFDFTSQLAPGDSVASVIAWLCSVISGGLDPNSQGLLTGGSTLTGNITAHMFDTASAIPGVTYAVSALIMTANGNKLLLWAPLPVESVP